MISHHRSLFHMPKPPDPSRQPPRSSQSEIERLIWPEPTAFMLSHCDHCALSQALRLRNGQIARLCLLDDNPILPGITDCNRFIAKPKTQRKTPT